MNLSAPLSINQKKQSNKEKSPKKINETVPAPNPNLEIDTRENRIKGKMFEQEDISAIDLIEPNIDLIESGKPQVSINNTGKATIGGPKLWTSLFQQNRAATHEMALGYIPPTIVDGKIVV